MNKTVCLVFKLNIKKNPSINYISTILKQYWPPFCRSTFQRKTRNMQRNAWSYFSPSSIPSSQAIFSIVFYLLLFFLRRYDAMCIWGKEHINNARTASNTIAAYVGSVGLPVLVMEKEGATFCNCSHPVCYTFDNLLSCTGREAGSENNSFFLCSLVSQLMPQGYSVCLTHTEHLHFPLPISSHCVNNGCGGRSNQWQRWAASSFFLAEIQRISCC